MKKQIKELLERAKEEWKDPFGQFWSWVHTRPTRGFFIPMAVNFWYDFSFADWKYYREQRRLEKDRRKSETSNPKKT